MRAKMISTTNKSFEYLIGVDGELSIGNVIDLRYERGNWFHTSQINTITYLRSEEKLVLDVKTKNSFYKFQVDY